MRRFYYVVLVAPSSGSGQNDPVIEAEFFGKLTLFLTGSHYYTVGQCKAC